MWDVFVSMRFVQKRQHLKPDGSGDGDEGMMESQSFCEQDDFLSARVQRPQVGRDLGFWFGTIEMRVFSEQSFG